MAFKPISREMKKARHMLDKAYARLASAQKEVEDGEEKLKDIYMAENFRICEGGDNVTMPTL